MIYKVIYIVFANVLICGILIFSYILDTRLGQTISLVVAGLFIGSIFTVLSWLINHSQMNHLEKRNLLIPLYVILSIAIFWLAAVLGNGSIFKLHKIEVFTFFNLAFAGGIFGLMMGCSLLFDYALLRASLSKLAFLVSLLCFSPMFIWYFSTDGLALVVSVILTRIILSIIMNRIFVDRFKEQVTPLGFFILSLTLMVLPLTAFLSK